MVTDVEVRKLPYELQARKGDKITCSWDDEIVIDHLPVLGTYRATHLIRYKWGGAYCYRLGTLQWFDTIKKYENVRHPEFPANIALSVKTPKLLF